MSPTSTSRGRSRALRLIQIACLERSTSKYLDGLKGYVSGLFPSVEVHTCPRAFRSLSAKGVEALATAFAASRVKDPERRVQDFEPMFGEVDYEQRVLRGETKASGVVYDGKRLQSLLSAHMEPRVSKTVAAIVLTDRLVATYSDDDLRHHLRTVVCGLPSIVSVPGIVEAPAKPREYYIMKQELELRGAGSLVLEKLKSSFKGRFIDYDDPEIPEVLKGLALQALVFHLTLDPFCADKKCRLFNAHWQEELIGSQIKHGGLCKKHKALLQSLSEKPVPTW